MAQSNKGPAQDPLPVYTKSPAPGPMGINERSSHLITPATMSRSSIVRSVTTMEHAKSSLFIKHPTSYVESLMIMVRTYVGNGVFAMGYAYKNTGLFLGIGSTIVFMIATIYSGHTLINCADVLRNKKGIKGALAMPEVVFFSLEEGPQCCSTMAPCVRKVVEISIIALQLSCCCVYIVFVGSTVKELIEFASSYDMDVRIYFVIVTIPMLITSFIRNLKYLAPFSLLANLITCLGVVFVIYVISQDLPPLSTRRLITNDITTYPVFFGTFYFSNAGIGMSLPCRNEMQKPELFNVWYGVLNVSMTINGILLVIVGALSYWKYGDEVLGSVTLNLPNNWLGNTIQGSLAVAVTLGFSLQFYLAHIMIWAELNARIGEIENDCLEAAMTVFLVACILLTAILLPKLGAVISLTGALTCSCLVFFYPHLSDIALRWPTEFGFLWWRFLISIILMAVAVITLILGVHISIIHFIDDMQ